MRIRINETSPAVTDELSEPTGPQLLAANMKSAFGTVGPAPFAADATDDSELTGPAILARNMRRAFAVPGADQSDATSPAVVANDGELTGPQMLARNVKTAFGATDAKKDDPWGPPWGHRVPAKKKRAPAAPAGSSAGASPAAGEEEDEALPHVVARRKAQAAQAAQMARPLPQKKVAAPGPKTMRLGPPSSGGDQ